jgi:hypothetical protein
VSAEGQIRELYAGSYALLVGIAAYQEPAAWTSLDSVPNELRALEDALTAQGFDAVQRLTNPTGEELNRTIKEFIGRYGFNPRNRLFFFFAGHGFTLDNGERGFFVPRDAPDPLRDEPGFRRVALSMQQVATWAQEITARHALFAFDSCFSGAIFRTRDRTIPQRINASAAQPVREFITAGGAGEPVPAQSVFTPLFVRGLNGAADLDGDGLVTGTELGNFVQREVIEYRTGQTPQFGKIRDVRFDQGDIVFLPPRSGSLASVSRASGTEKPRSRPAAPNAEGPTRTPSGESVEPKVNASAANWAGSYEGALGVRMTLTTGLNGTFGGELIISNTWQMEALEVSLRAAGPNRLDGMFGDALRTFPLRVERAADPNRIVLNSQGHVYELQRVGTFSSDATSAPAPHQAGGLSQPAATGRNIFFNGSRLDVATLERLEGPIPVIPDGQYWYDKRSGSAGLIGGPTLGYFAPDLDFFPPMSPHASGGGTNVVVNGRYLHPVDLAGLQYYFGTVQPGRYWLDGQGNYGVENGPALGNLVQQIAMLQAVSQTAVGGGSVYQYFPNLGTGGSGVTWWPRN